MSGPSTHPLNRTRIQQLLAAVGSAPIQEPSVPNLTEYDWRDPHFFNADQLNRLAAMMSHAAALIGASFSHFYGRDFQVAPRSITQHFANDAHDLVDADGSYCLAFGPANGQPCGFLAVPAESAIRWVTRLLGDTESPDDSKRTLSSLEQSLLSDLMTAVVEAFLTPIRASSPMKPAGEVCQGRPTIRFEPVDALCRTAFHLKTTGPDEETEILFLQPCSRLAPLVGKTVETRRPTPAQELTQTLMEHLQHMPVTVTARLASATIRFGEVADLEPNDILLFDKGLEGSVELVIDGRTIFRGRPARSNGRYAVVITESEPGRTRGAKTDEKSSHTMKG